MENVVAHVGKDATWMDNIPRYAMENHAPWIAVTVRTPLGPSEVMDAVKRYLTMHGWNIEFSANWWSPASYGVVMVEATKNGDKKVLVVKWAVGRRPEVVKVETKDEDKGKEELFTIIDMVSDNLLHDCVLRTMMNRY